MRDLFTRRPAWILFVCGFTVCCPLGAHDKLTPQQIQQYTADGTYDERVGRILSLEQFKLGEGRRQRAIYKIRRAALEASGLSESDAARTLSSGPQMAFPFTAQPELRSTGTVKTLTILIDFQDQRAATALPGMTTATFTSNIYGAGTMPAQTFVPFESLHNYYSRASQGLVDVQGNVLGWHSFPDNRSTYEPAKAPASLPPNQRRQEQARLDNAANFKLVSTAMSAFDATHDFAQYDNDNDGDIDLVTILYAGPPTGWGSFWWAYRWEFFISEALTKKFDGKRVKQFVFQFVSTRGPMNQDFDPTTLLHEMGHAFGLADYYDYDSGVGPDGGVGGLDMMDANQGNQNAFSRWLLDWIKPTVVGTGAPAVRQLTASGATQNTKKALAIFPGLSNSSAPSSEMFIIEHRNQVGNDLTMPNSGILIWHIDASLNSDESDFGNDNSFSDRKLIRLVRADNANDFGDADSASAATYFVNGGQLTPTSTPNSNGYDDFTTNIAIDQISVAGDVANVRVGFLGAPMPILAAAPPADPGPDPAPQPAPQTVQALASGAADAPIDLDVLENLDRQFSASTAEQLATIWQQVERKQPAGSGATSPSLTLKLLLTHWASKNGEAAVKALLELPTTDKFVRDTYPRLMQAWARQAPIKAAEWYLAANNAALRESTSLEAGSEFAHEVFEHLFLVNPEQAIDSLGKLKHTSEVIGAVQGLRHASNQVAQGAEILRVRLKGIQENAEVIRAADQYLQATEAARAAAQQIKDARQRAEFQKVLQSQPH